MTKVLWTQKQDIGPSGRGAHAITYDSDQKRVVLFGGSAAGDTLRADTWEWDGADWTQVADTGPDARSGHALAYDADRKRTVLFGGSATGDTLRADTWEWDGADWTQVADTGPGPSFASAMAFEGGAPLLFGGVNSPTAGVAAEVLSKLSWQWDGAHWTLRQDMGPVPRWGHALACDSERGRPVLFGGFSVLPAYPSRRRQRPGGHLGSLTRGDTRRGSRWRPGSERGPGSGPRCLTGVVHAQPRHDHS
jgi:hypothetical protein